VHDTPSQAGAFEGAYYDPRRYTQTALAAIEHVRYRLGDEIELLHDVHERLKPSEAVEFAKALEPYRLFFLEDLLSPEDIEWFANVRAVCTTPLAMGELFCHPREWTPLITGRLIDFLRMHISTIGGLTPARKVAAMGELVGVRTAWHGPGDVSPVGHAANVHLDLATPNFGIQEFSGFSDEIREVFPGCPELRDGCLHPNEAPGLGIDVDEAAAARFPCQVRVDTWTQARRPDGSVNRP
jgi:mannonate dehydratase